MDNLGAVSGLVQCRWQFLARSHTTRDIASRHDSITMRP